MKKIKPSKILYIKLGTGGSFEKECIEKGLLKLDYRELEHEIALEGDKEKIVKAFMEKGSKQGAASNHARQVISFYHEPEDTMWITFHDDKLWWGFANAKVTYDKKTKTKTRKIKGGWKSTSLDGTELSFDILPQDIINTKGYRGTICEIKDERKDSLRKVINDEAIKDSDHKNKTEQSKEQPEDAEKLLQQGNKYKNGDGVEVDLEKAFHYYKLAAEQGNATAQYALGDMYEFGVGVEENLEEALHWYKLAAKQGDIDAIYQLGIIYKDEIENAEEAVKWLSLGAEDGDPGCQNLLGCVYSDISDHEKAAYWFNLAAEQGDESALDNIKNMIEEGEYTLKVDFQEEYLKIAPILFHISWDRAYPYRRNKEYESIGKLDVHEIYEVLSEAVWKTVVHSKYNELDEISKEFMDIIIIKTILWMTKKAQSFEMAQEWLDDNSDLIKEYEAMINLYSPGEPYHFRFWKELSEKLDGDSGLVFDLDYDLLGNVLQSNEYIYKDLYFVFRLKNESTLLVYLISETENREDNISIITKIKEYLVAKNKTKNISLIEDLSEGKAQAICLTVKGFNLSNIKSYEKAHNAVENYLSAIEDAIEEISYSDLPKSLRPAYPNFEPEGSKQIEEITELDEGITRIIYWRYGTFELGSYGHLRKNLLECYETGEDFTVWEFIDLTSSYDENWIFPDTDLGNELQEMFNDGYVQEIEERLMEEGWESAYNVGGKLMFVVDSDKEKTFTPAGALFPLRMPEDLFKKKGKDLA